MNDTKASQTRAPASALASAGRRVLQLALLLLVLLTIYLSAGRLLMPVLTTQKDQVENRMSQLLGTAVSVGSLRGSWFRFSPGFELGALSLQFDPADEASRLSVSYAELTLDLWSTLRHGQLSLAHMKLSQLELALEQTSDGRWTLLGLAPGDRDYKDRIMDLVLGTPFAEISEANLLVRLADGRQLSLQSVFIQVENRGQEHRLSLQFRLGAENNLTLAVLEIQGDPRSDFAAQAWLGTDQLDLQSLAALFADQLQTDEISASGQFWLALDNSGLTSLKGQLSHFSLLGTYGASALPLQLNSAEFNFVAGRSQSTAAAGGAAATSWQLALRDLFFDWNHNPWEVSALNLKLPLDPAATMQVQAETLDISMLASIAESLPLPGKARTALTTLAPAGSLRHVLLETARDGQYPDLFKLQGNFEQVAVEAWNGAPQASGLSGYTEVSATSGLAEVDSEDATIHLPNLFRESWHYDQLGTRVNWSVQNGEVKIASTPIHIRNEFLQGRVQFSLHNQRSDQGALLSDFSLLVGMDYMDVATHSAYLPTLPKLAPTMQWLDSALQGGRIVDSGFVLRTPVGEGALRTSVSQSSWFRVEQGQLQFLPDWPQVLVETAGIVGHDQNTDIQAANASLAGLQVETVKAQIRPAQGAGSLLTLQATTQTETASGLDFLRTTPLREYVGEALDNWDASGQLGLEVNLGIPLGENPAERQIAVAATSRDSVLSIRDYSLDLAAINGLISYHQDAGLQAAGLSAQMFSSPVSIDISTRQDSAVGSRTIVVNSSGRAATAELAAWPGQAAFVRSLLGFTEGDLGFRASLELPGADSGTAVPRLQIQADLQGMESDFPIPFNKTAAETAQLQLDLSFLPEGQTVVLRYNDMLSGQLVLNARGIDRGQLYFGGLNQNFTIRQTNAAEPGLLVNGELPDFSYDDWRVVVDRLTAEGSEDASSLKEYLRLIDVNIGKLQVLGQSFDNINVQVQYQDDAMHIYGRNALLAGNFILPDAEAEPWDIKLDYLRFPPRIEPDPEATEAEEEEDLLQELDPATLPAFTFNTAELSIGESNLGSFSFALQPDAHGARISNFLMQETSSTITGSSADSGADVDWSYSNGEHRSRFEGVFAAGDLSMVMPKWGHDANIVSRQARFSGTLSWPGSPLAFSLKKASGEISMAINDGRFVDIDSGSSKLLGAFNFDALIRRLELDFSDLYERGFSYDTIRGELVFTDGVVQTRTPLIIDGPSSRLNISGEISLPEETIAADMQVRIPLGENLSMLAGLLGAWPIALSTYLASKIFADQVEDFTTIIYRLEGTWENPQAGFEAPSEEVKVNE